MTPGTPAPAASPDPFPQDASPDLLVEAALDETVRTGAPRAARELVAELTRRGDDAFWQGVLLVLGLLATRPVYGLGELQGVERLRQVARTADPVTSLALGVQAVHRAEGAVAAREIWSQDTQEIRETALIQLLIAAAFVIGSSEGHLSAPQTVRLIKEAVIRTGSSAASGA
ncbi:hypothetical protein ACIRST_37890 [Kitasatospora sp. NPDC101447]|uniref:hypothetical protein n=1 Tax=Kitasatospora sp. NPDC101447 TaxID=3364102 RepID=UPI0037F57CBE